MDVSTSFLGQVACESFHSNPLKLHEVLVDQTSKTVVGLRDTCSSVRVIMFFCRVATTACQSLVPHTGVDHLLGVATNGRIIFFLLFLVDTQERHHK